MKKDLEVIEALKNNDERRIAFFKNKIKEELVKNKMPISDNIINKHLEEGIKNYDESIKVPFLFYLRSLIRNSNENKTNNDEQISDNNLFNKKELEILKWYLGYNNKFLNNTEIALETGYTITEVIETLKKFNKIKKNNQKEVLEVFPDYKDKLKERNIYFTKGTITITEKQLRILETYLNNDVTETAKVHNLTEYMVKKELTNCYKLLKYQNNLNLILKRNPNLTEEMIIKKGKLIASRPKSHKRTRARLTEKDIEILRVLYEKNNLSSSEMAKLLNYKDRKSFGSAKTILFNKLRDNKNLKVQALKYCPTLDIPSEKRKYNYQISTEDKALINLLLKYKDNDEKIMEELNFEKDVYLDKKEKLLQRISKSKKIIKELKKEFNDIESILPLKKLTQSQKNLLILLNETKNEPLSDEEMAIRLNLKNKESYLSEKRILFKLLRENKELLEESKEFYQDIDVTPKASSKELTENDLKLLTLLYETKNKPLPDEEFAIKLGYVSVESYRTSKSILLNKIEINKKIKKEVAELFPNIDFKNMLKFTENEITFLTNYCYLDEKNSYLTQREISTKMNIRADSLNTIKKNALNKIKLASEQKYNLDIILWPNFLDDLIIRENFKYSNSFIINENDLKNIKELKGNISKAIKCLEKSIYKKYVIKCSFNIKIMLALRLGFFNKRSYSSNEVAKILDIPVENVIEISKECLNSVKNIYLNNKEITPNTVIITPREIKILKSLKENLSNEKIANSLNIKNHHFFETIKYNLFQKLRTNPGILDKAKEYCPNIEFIINKKNITQEEEALFKLLLQYKNDDERDRKIADTLEISIEETKYKITSLYNKIQKDSTLKEYITNKYCESTEIKTLFKPQNLTERQKEILELLDKHKDNPLPNEEMAKLLGYKNTTSYMYARNAILRIIKKDEVLHEKAKEIFENVDIILTSRNLELLSLLNNQSTENLSEDEIAKKLGYNDIKNYRKTKSRLINKIEANEELKQKVKEKFPNINLQRTLKLTEKEINFLKEYCYIKEDGNYQNLNELSSKFGISNSAVKTSIQRAVDKAKIIYNENYNLDETFWPHFVDDLMIRKNFNPNKSFTIQKEDSENKVSKAVNYLENSIFKDYVKDCPHDTKILLALRLGYFNKRTFSSEEVAELLNIPVETVIRITKECLEQTKDKFYNSNNNEKELKKIIKS